MYIKFEAKYDKIIDTGLQFNSEVMVNNKIFKQSHIIPIEMLAVEGYIDYFFKMFIERFKEGIKEK